MIRIGGRSGSALAAAAMAFLAARFAWSQPPAPPAVPVAAALVSTMKTASGQPFVGTVLPARTSDVGSAVDGRLTELPIVDG
jgi:multidrug efflux pump subunit AcrA (membrane-fusion protein)